MDDQLSSGSVPTNKAGQMKNEKPAKQPTPITETTTSIKVELVDDYESEEEYEPVVKKRGRPSKDASSASDIRVKDEHRSGGSKPLVKLETDNQVDQESEEEDEPPNNENVYKCPQPGCSYWAKLVERLHRHVLEEHGTGQLVFKCTGCTFRAQMVSRV